MEAEIKFWNRVDVKGPSECWPWKEAQTGGYGTLGWNNQTAYAHRIAFEIFYHRKPEKSVLHICDNKLCVNPNHLYGGNHVENSRDLYSRGGGKRKLSDEDVREIRRLHKIGSHSLRELASKFGCIPQNISHILNGHTFSYLLTRGK